MALWLRSVVLGLTLVLASCTVRTSNEPAVLATGRLGAPRHPRAPPPPSSEAPAPAPEVEAPKADPEASRQFLAHIAEPRMPLLPTDRASGVTMAALANTARGEAAGMSANGPVLTATLAEGHGASAPLVLPPGSCTTFLAHGGLGVVEVDLFITTGVAPAVRVLAEDPTSGPIAVIGGRAECFANPLGVPLLAELHARVRRGAGQVLVQSYRR